MRSVISCITILLLMSIGQLANAQVQLSVAFSQARTEYDGRLFVVFSREDGFEPRFFIGEQPAPRLAPPFFAVQLQGWDGSEIQFEPTSGFPLQQLEQLEQGRWYVQALFDFNDELSALNAPGNLYSAPQAVDLDSGTQSLHLELTEAIPPESLPEETELLKFVRIRSDLLSEFYQRDMYLRASVLLPPGYSAQASERYPVLYHVAGLNGRYSRSLELLEDEEFMAYWQDRQTRPAVIVFLDGESPFGDSYQVNSAVSGPYADANFSELFPYLAQRFPIDDRPATRYVSGCSTGGWVSLALQIYYPDYFNGAYSLSPDSPSFRAFQLVDLYQDDNAYYSPTGMIRPSARETNGDPIFSILDEIRMEAAMGRNGSFATSGQQWGTWNAVYGQPDADGNPIPVWDQETGSINRAVVDAWRSWDLDSYVRENWTRLGPELAGKLHFWMGDMDDYYLTNGLRILEETLNVMEAPAADAQFTWVPYHGHCDFGTQIHFIDVLEDLTQKSAAGM
jgi:S-formylglutathione hydrolase FrmB